VATNLPYHAETLRRSHRYEQRRRSFLGRVFWHWLTALVLVCYTAVLVATKVDLSPSIALVVVGWIAWIATWPRYPHGR